MNDSQKFYLVESARWQKALGVFIAIATVVLFLLGQAFIIMPLAGLDFVDTEEYEFGPEGFVALGIVYIICAVIYLFFALYLLRAANAMDAWLNHGDDASLTKSLKYTKGFFKYAGILTILSFAFILLLIVIIAIIILASTL